MKKRLCSFLFLFTPLLFAKPFSVSFLTLERPEFSITQSFEYNFMHSVKYENSGYATVATVDAKELLCTGGFYTNRKASDAAIQTWYAPCFWDLLSVGVTAKYHYYKYNDGELVIFCEHTVLPGLFARVNLNNIWNLYLTAGTVLKFSIIDAYPSNIRTYDNTVFLNTGCIFTPTEKWRFFLELGTCSLFEDGMSGVFMFDLGGSYRLFEHMSFGTEVYGKWTDTSVPQDSFSQFGIRVNWGVLF